MNRDVPEVATLIEGMCKVMKECGAELDSIAIPGFGTFKSSKIEEQVVYDNITRQRTLVPPMIVMEFNPSVVLRKKMSK